MTAHDEVLDGCRIEPGPLAHDCTDILMFERSDERPQAAVLRCQHVDLAAGLREIPCHERQDRAKRSEPILKIGAIDGARLIVHLGALLRLRLVRDHPHPRAGLSHPCILASPIGVVPQRLAWRDVGWRSATIGLLVKRA
jgi:hypothetical protein